MPTLSFYNHVPLQLVTNLLPATDTYKVLLLNSSASFDGAHTNISSLISNEVYGNNWPQGGVTLANVAFTATNVDTDSNDVGFFADDVNQSITGGDLDPVSAYCVYNSTTGAPVCFVQLDSPITVLQNNSAVIEWTDGMVFYIENAAS